MGVLRKGIFGGFQNKTGPLVGRNVNGTNVITGLHHVSNKPRTAAQQYQTAKLNYVFEHMRKVKSLVAIGFKYAFKKGNAFTTAVSYNFEHALIDNGTDFRLDYKTILYSKGALEKAFTPHVSLSENYISYSWSLLSHFNYDDLATFLVYNEDQDLFTVKIDAAKRSQCGYALELPEHFAQGKLHCYMSLRSVKQRKVSNSVYVGLIII